MAVPGSEDWSDWARRAPVGVLALAALLVFLGAGLVLGGAYLALSGEVGWVPALVAVGVGPLVLYVALHLVRLTRWAWSTIILLFALLMASSALRALRGGDELKVAVAELAVEAACLAYLLRPAVRRAFGWR